MHELFRHRLQLDIDSLLYSMTLASSKMYFNWNPKLTGNDTSFVFLFCLVPKLCPFQYWTMHDGRNLRFMPRASFAMGGFGLTVFAVVHQQRIQFRWKGFVNICIQPTSFFVIFAGNTGGHSYDIGTQVRAHKREKSSFYKCNRGIKSMEKG